MFHLCFEGPNPHELPKNLLEDTKKTRNVLGFGQKALNAEPGLSQVWSPEDPRGRWKRVHREQPLGFTLCWWCWKILLGYLRISGNFLSRWPYFFGYEFICCFGAVLERSKVVYNLWILGISSIISQKSTGRMASTLFRVPKAPHWRYFAAWLVRLLKAFAGSPGAHIVNIFIKC